MIAAGVIGGVFIICTVVMFLGVKERDGENFESKRRTQYMIYTLTFDFLT